MRRERKQVTPDIALAKAEALCSVAEYCTDDILKKLSRWNLSLSESGKIIQRLVETRFIDNRRFALAFVRDKYRFSKWGVRKIRFALYQKHISSDIINEALEEGIDPEEYYSILLAVLRSKSRSIKEGNCFEGRTKLFRFAASRGYETDLIARAIRTERVFENADDESYEDEIQ